MNKEKSDVLKELGWTPDDARRFLEKWEQMQRAAREPGPKQKAAKQQLDDALKSLGLRPRGTEESAAPTRPATNSTACARTSASRRPRNGPSR